MDKIEDSSEYSISHFNGGNFNMFQPNFKQETNFETLISSINGVETVNPIKKLCINYDCNHVMNTCTEMELQLPPISYDHNGGGDVVGRYEMMNPDLDINWNQKEVDVKIAEAIGDDDSSETPTTGNLETSRRSAGAGKGDRKRTLVSERRRRNGMKEMLYTLRSLVPNITKMDKASIVGDAARYIQDLQMQARNLRNEIATIEETKTQKTPSQSSKKNHTTDSCSVMKKIYKLDMFQVEEKGYYVRLVCTKGRGVAVSLHKALESITSFQVHSSNLTTVNDTFMLTFTLNVTRCEFDINLPNLKLWLASAFLNQGFEFNAIPSP